MSAEKIQELTPKDHVLLAIAEDSPETAIAKLKEKYTGLKANTKENYELVKKGHTDCVSRRTSIDKRRLSLKRDVDSQALKLTELLAPIEAELKIEKDKYEAVEKARKAAADAAKALAGKERKDKIQARLTSFSSHSQNLMTKTAEQLKTDLEFFRACIANDNFDYAEFLNEAEKIKFNTEQALSTAYKDRAGLERREAEVAKQKEELAVQQKIIDEANRIIAEKAAQEELRAFQPAPIPKGMILIDDPIAKHPEQNILLNHAAQVMLDAYDNVDCNSRAVRIPDSEHGEYMPSNNQLVALPLQTESNVEFFIDTYSMGAKLELLIGFIEEITLANGKYPDLNGHQIVIDARKVLQKIGVSK